MYKAQRKPDATVEFEHRIREEWVYVEGEAWGDENGIYKTSIAKVSLFGVDVIGLLTDDDVAEIKDAIEENVHAEAGDRRASGTDTIPGPFPTL